MKIMIVEIEYTNYRGVRKRYKIVPHEIRFGSNDWHKDDQWLLKAWDFDRSVIREFAMQNIHDWSPA